MMYWFLHFVVAIPIAAILMYTTLLLTELFNESFTEGMDRFNDHLIETANKIRNRKDNTNE